ncbi:glycosyl transferase family 2 [Helicobacter sp. 16-1353]|nr:glycosyl transferase family 2 [Helicobacter sp. 16-1353]
MKISVTIIAKNAQKHLSECLQSLSEFDEIILLDNESSDETREIAKSYPNVRIFSTEFIGFGAMKNLAISYAKNEWIFSIDSDEIAEPDLLEEIKNLKFKQNEIYAISRKNLYKNEWIKACGWYPDYVNRIFNKNFTKFNDNEVHESVTIPKNAKILRLDSHIKHYAYGSISQLSHKMEFYSTLWARNNAHKSATPLKAIVRSMWSFVRNYLFKKGFLYGYKGFIISFFNASGVLVKYMKLYELKTRENSVSLIITTYNQKESLRAVLDSTLRLNKMPSEILIADDGSKADTRELVESYKAKFHIPLIHIWHEDRGFRLSHIRNLAIDSANGEYIIIIDGDMILEPNFVSDHLEKAKKGVFLQGSRVILDEKVSKEILALTSQNGGNGLRENGGNNADNGGGSK